MTGKELIKETSKRTGYEIYVCDEILKEAWRIIGDQLEGYGNVKIPNLGVFEVYKRQGHQYFDNYTKDMVKMEPYMYPRFRASKELKNRIRK